MRVLELLLILFICAIPALARADTIYQVTGSATITGNNNCNGPCRETIDFSFLVSYTFAFSDTFGTDTVFNFYQAHLLQVLSVDSAGPLTPFTLRPGGGGSGADYFGFFNANGDEIDVDGPNWDGELAPRPFPDLVGSELYGCGQGIEGASPVCVQDFGTGFPIAYGHVRFGTAEATVTTVATPEGSTRLYLLVGIGLGLLGMLSRSHYGRILA